MNSLNEGRDTINTDIEIEGVEEKGRKRKQKRHDSSTWVSQREKINFDLTIRNFPFTQKQRDFIDLCLDKETRVVFLSGPAGSSKSFLAVYVALQMLQSRKNGEIIYVRNLIESSTKGMGFLPGEAGDKFQPFAQPLFDKLEELLPKSQIDKLNKEGRIKGIPINFLRGSSFNATTVIADELQNFSEKEIVTFITRIGKYSKFILLGDPKQSDLNGGKSVAFEKIIDAFDDEESASRGIHVVRFGKEDIMRSEILKFIIEKLEDSGIV